MSYTHLIRSIVTGSPLSPKDRKERKPVNITANVKNVVVRHKKQNMLIKRRADPSATIPELFSKTSRPCPPFCIQPMKVADGVETIGELEMLEYMAKTTEDDNETLIIDSRMENWVSKGTIPCSVNIPWTRLVADQGANTKDILSILQNEFNVDYANTEDSDQKTDLEDSDQKTDLEHSTELVERVERAIVEGSISKLFDFSKAKTLVLFCNGAWCGQTSESIKALIKFGYPTEKIKYFRNGMQGWVGMGLTTVSDENEKHCHIN